MSTKAEPRRSQDLSVSGKQPLLAKAAEILSTKPEGAEKAHNHEAIGAKIILRRNDVYRTLKPYADPEIVALLIQGRAADAGLPAYVGALMHSSLDADRLDYLQRDCAETGTVYGHVDSRYIADLLGEWATTTSVGGTFSNGGWPSVEQQPPIRRSGPPG